MSAPLDPEKRKAWKEKISATKKGCVSPNKGKKFSVEWKKNLSLAHLGKKQRQESIDKMTAHHLGEKSHFWKGGLDLIPGRRNWIKNKRNRVLKRLRIVSGSHTYGEWELLKKQYNFTCLMCLKSEPEIILTEDHVIPLSKGGSDLIENIQPLCGKCNRKKHTRIIRLK